MITEQLRHLTEQTETPKNGEKQININKKEVAQHFIRVGDFYYRKVKKPTQNGDFVETFLPIAKQTIIDDYGRPIISKIKKFYGFITIPSHTNFQEEHGGFYNIYKKVDWKAQQGEFSCTQKFLHHIFGEHYNLGLDYLTILWRYPVQRLPILSLVSKERATGKTTFLQWLQIIFGENVIRIGNQELESQFNSFLLGKLIVGIDETFLEKKQLIEKIKNLATANKIYVNAKFKEGSEQDFFVKFILLSNNVDNFITTDEDENRYWVIEVPVLENEISDFQEKLKEEIPAFIYFLSNREITYQKKTRFWFDYKIYRTKALERIILKSKPKVQQILEEFLKNVFIATQEATLFFTPLQIKNLLFQINQKYDEIYIKNIMEKIGFEKYTIDGKIAQKRHKVYSIDRNGELITDKAKDYPHYITLNKFGFNPDDYTKDPNDDTLPF